MLHITINKVDSKQKLSRNLTHQEFFPQLQLMSKIVVRRLEQCIPWAGMYSLKCMHAHRYGSLCNLHTHSMAWPKDLLSLSCTCRTEICTSKVSDTVGPWLITGLDLTQADTISHHSGTCINSLPPFLSIFASIPCHHFSPLASAFADYEEG